MNVREAAIVVKLIAIKTSALFSLETGEAAIVDAATNIIIADIDEIESDNIWHEGA